MPAVARSRLCSRVSAWAGAFAKKRYVIGLVGVGNCFCGVPYYHSTTLTRKKIYHRFLTWSPPYLLPKFLNNEFYYVENSFFNILYLKPFLHFAKSKAFEIHNRNRSRTNDNTPTDKIIFPRSDFAIQKQFFH